MGGQLTRLRAALDLGAAAYGWGEDQRWTLARVTALMARLFHMHYTLRGTSYRLHRMGFSPQVLVHRAAERDEAVIAADGDLGEGLIRHKWRIGRISESHLYRPLAIMMSSVNAFMTGLPG